MEATVTSLELSFASADNPAPQLTSCQAVFIPINSLTAVAAPTSQHLPGIPSTSFSKKLLKFDQKLPLPPSVICTAYSSCPDSPGPPGNDTEEDGEIERWEAQMCNW